jgi:hypothetical protein
MGLAAVALVACGGSTAESATPTDGGGRDAQVDGASADSSPGSDGAVVDAPADSPAYLECMSATGQLDGTLKTCQSDTDCVIKQEQTDCCGTILYVGVDQAGSA